MAKQEHRLPTRRRCQIGYHSDRRANYDPVPERSKRRKTLLLPKPCHDVSDKGKDDVSVSVPRYAGSMFPLILIRFSFSHVYHTLCP